MIRLPEEQPEQPRLKTKAEVARMRRVGRRLTEILLEAGRHLTVGGRSADAVDSVTRSLRTLGAETITELMDFPAVLCASRNNVAAHGLPDETRLEFRDLVTLDIAARVDGWCADVAWTFAVGEPPTIATGGEGPSVAVPARGAVAGRKTALPSDRGRHLRTAAWDTCMAGIAACRPGNRVGDVAAAMTRTAAAAGCQVVPEFAGHGIGRDLHEEPSLSPRGLPGTGARLLPGMVVTVEPVVVAGSPEVAVLPDGWTYVTADGSLAAQFEFMVYIHRDGNEIISLPDRLSA